jgi:predicted glycoside hydrolase/deacetylase ChbG (UPF0249 family)
MNEMLGYRKEERLLIINIDDYGICNSANEAAIEILRKGNASSCTIMMPCPWSLSGIQRLKRHPEIEVGVHLTVISEQSFYRWGPINSIENVPSLIDKTGKYFYSEKDMKHYIANAKVKELELEFKAQIDAAISQGIVPTHLDGHCHAHERREDIFEMTLKLSQEYGLPLRIKNDEYRKRARERGLPVIDYSTLDSFRINTEEKPEHYIKLLKNLPSGISEWAIHPALKTGELIAISPEEWHVRDADYNFFNSETFTKILKEEQINVISYKCFKEYWK